jgi:hypothetical protein
MASRTGAAGRQAGSETRLADIRMAPIVIQVNAMKALGVTRQAARKVADALEQRGYATTEEACGPIPRHHVRCGRRARRR